MHARLGARVDEGFEVRVDGVLELHDHNRDDPFTGWADFVLFVEPVDLLAPVTPLVP